MEQFYGASRLIDEVMNMDQNPRALAEHALRRYGDILFRIALNQLQDSAAAQDAVQDCLVKLLTLNRNFADEEHLKRWLIRVTVNLCHDRHRCAWSTRVDALETETSKQTASSAEDIAIRRLAADPLWQAIKRLPDTQRAVVHLRYVENMSDFEIAEALGISTVTVRTRLFRARKRLQALIKEQQIRSAKTATPSSMPNTPSASR